MTTAHEARRILLACRSCIGGGVYIGARNGCKIADGWMMDENDKESEISGTRELTWL